MSIYDLTLESAEYIKQKISGNADVLVVLGTGLGDFADKIDNKIVIDYRDIPNFKVSTAQSHKGKLVFAEMFGKRVLIMQGRLHLYEGYSFFDTAYPLLVTSFLGVKNVVLTNAAGAINTDYGVSDVVAVYDHIKLVSESPCTNLKDERFGEFFFDVSNVYSKKLIDIAEYAAKDLNIPFHKGVYAFMAGPQFETPAEIKALRVLGADVVGMSTVAESIMAAKRGMNVLCLSIVSNMAAGMSDAFSGHDVDKAMAANKDNYVKILNRIVKDL